MNFDLKKKLLVYRNPKTIGILLAVTIIYTLAGKFGIGIEFPAGYHFA